MSVEWDLVCADCSSSDGMSTLDDSSIDITITDPPYDEHTHACGRRGATNYKERPSQRATFNRARDLGFEAITPEQMMVAAREIARVTKRWVLTFCSLEMISAWRAAYESFGLDYIRGGVWVKQGAAPSFTGDRPAAGAEAIVIAHRPGRKRWNGGGSHALWETDGDDPIPDEFRHIWKEPIVLDRGKREPRLHTTQKPLPLMEKLVAQFSEPGETILDPFAGSGTTGVAARRLGRSFLGFERDERYAAAARARIGNTREQMGLPGMVGS